MSSDFFLLKPCRCFVLLIFALVVPSLAQISGGLNETTRTDYGGKHYISGTVFGPGGSPVKTRMRVRLSSPMGEIIATTDDVGRFVFSRLGNGLYTITIDGEKEFEPVSEQIDIGLGRNASPQSFNVSLRLVEKNTRTFKPGVIRSDQADIPKEAMERYYKGIALSKKGNYRSAVDEFLQAIKIYPQFTFAFTEIGIQYINLNELEKADEYLQSALKIKPDAYEPLVNRGIVLVRLKRFIEAESLLRDAIKVREQSAIAHYYLGRSLVGQNLFDEAEKVLKTALAIAGNEINEARRTLADIYFEKQDYKLALAELEAYLTVAPQAPDAARLRTIIDQLKKFTTEKQKP